MLRVAWEDIDLTVSIDSDSACARTCTARASNAPNPVPTPVPGDVIGERYRIEARLGQGGMAVVFRATQLLSEKQVALKWIPHRTTEEHARARFALEARAAGRIEHPNVVAIYDVAQESGFGYLVMELLHGESLRARLDRGRLPVSEAVELLLPAMRGISAAHRAGVIHRDLKPDNVFLCRGSEGQAHVAKVFDFGISHIADLDSVDFATTREGVLLGTPLYMSPEQLRSARDLDVRTDIYSFGVILYEALTGRVPFSEETFSALVLAVAQTEPPRPSLLVPDVSPELEQVILRAIAKDRHSRYPDMNSFISALEKCGRRPAPEPAPSLSEYRARPSRTWATGGMVLAVSLLGASATNHGLRAAGVAWLDSFAPSHSEAIAIDRHGSRGQNLRQTSGSWRGEGSAVRAVELSRAHGSPAWVPESPSACVATTELPTADAAEGALPPLSFAVSRTRVDGGGPTLKPKRGAARPVRPQVRPSPGGETLERAPVVKARGPASESNLDPGQPAPRSGTISLGDM